MYIELVPNRDSPPAILLRESYREGGKVRKRTLLNLSDWPSERIAGFKALLKGGTVIPSEKEAISIIRSLPHGHVAAALGTARRIGLDRLIGPDGDRRRDLVLALAVSRILDPSSKLAAARALSPETAASSLGDELGLGIVDEEELYAALDWLAVRQPAIEAMLAKRHLSGGTLVLYDVTSSSMEGRCCPLARFGDNRDGKKGKLQIVYGLLCAPDGCPVAVEVFEGSTGDPATLGSQVAKLKQRFGLDHVVLVGDRGMITDARIAEDIQPAGLDRITALRAPAIRRLLDGDVGFSPERLALAPHGGGNGGEIAFRGAQQVLALAGALGGERGVAAQDEALAREVGRGDDGNGAGFGKQQVERMDVVQLAVRNVDEARNIAPQIEQGVHLHRRLGRPQMRPGKDRQTQVDRCRIQGIRWRRASSPGQSVAGPNPRRCASRAFRWRPPASSAGPVRANPCGRASTPGRTGRFRYRAGSPGRSVGQTPWPDIARRRGEPAPDGRRRNGRQSS